MRHRRCRRPAFGKRQCGTGPHVPLKASSRSSAGPHWPQPWVEISGTRCDPVEPSGDEVTLGGADPVQEARDFVAEMGRLT